ncbi:MAG: hypothetical protein SOX46_10850 [Clostridiaceae bacterium]|nr:hypothetical protein [Clostridiaceae bacterium]
MRNRYFARIEQGLPDSGRPCRVFGHILPGAVHLKPIAVLSSYA